MQWDSGPHAGLSGAQPWRPIADADKRVNGAVHREDARSIPSLFRELIRLRRSTPASAIGSTCACRWMTRCWSVSGRRKQAGG
jgi:alpha-glucosidase